MDCDGISVEVAKMQKRTIKKSKNGGADTISLSNSYEVNGVEYSERDFKKKMAEYGFDFDLFLPLSHPDVFTSQKSADMRKVLFGMASEKSDKEIANMTDNTEDVAEMLTNYTAEEVKAMQNATLRKIREEYGKDGEILRAKIEGMEQSKTDIDVAELERLKNSLNEQISDNKAKQEDILKEFEEQQKASDGILELKFELNDLQRKVNEELEKKRREITRKSDDLITKKNDLVYSINDMKKDWSMLSDRLKTKQESLEKARAEYEKSISLEFDENSLICQYCGQAFPSDKQEQIKGNFEDNKAKDVEKIKVRGNSLNEEAKQINSKMGDLEKLIKEKQEKYFSVEKELKELMAEEKKLPQSIDISDRPEVQEIQRQIAEKETAMSKGSSAEEIRQRLKAEEENLQSQLTEVEKQLALAKRNIEIDEDISKLREKQKSFEQQKANCEKILFQLDLVSRKKNELLTEDINKNFDIVKWQMFEYQKNGDYKDCCIPTIDSKRFGESTNTGREVLAKLDIIKGLQRFYGQSYPIFLDGAECLSDETVKRIEMDCQLILLKVTEDKELKIEMEG